MILKHGVTSRRFLQACPCGGKERPEKYSINQLGQNCCHDYLEGKQIELEKIKDKSFPLGIFSRDEVTHYKRVCMSVSWSVHPLVYSACAPRPARKALYLAVTCRVSGLVLLQL